MTRYAIEITAHAACGCRMRHEFPLNEGAVPTPGDTAAYLVAALDPEVTNLFDHLASDRHSPGGTEKITVTAQVKVR